jgi:hypothetical protein
MQPVAQRDTTELSPAPILLCMSFSKDILILCFLLPIVKGIFNTHTEMYTRVYPEVYGLSL